MTAEYSSYSSDDRSYLRVVAGDDVAGLELDLLGLFGGAAFRGERAPGAEDAA
jgi:hypothetical protein